MLDAREPAGCRSQSPWREVRDARRTLSDLAEIASGRSDRPLDGATPPAVDRARLVPWLVRHQLAGIAYAACRVHDPELAAPLMPAASGAAAGSLAQLDLLERIERLFAQAEVPAVVLKGAALARIAYRDPAFRTMSDIDLWVLPSDIERAAAALEMMGFRREGGLADRPDALQREASGEVGFHLEGRRHGRIELHYGVFQGWWARRTALTDGDALWRRAMPLGPGRHLRALAPEDCILHAAFHNAVNQLGQAPLRGLMDIAVVSRAMTIDWDEVARRAEAFRLATATWLVLDTADALIGLPGAAAALGRLRPELWRRKLLRSLIDPSGVLSGVDLTRTSKRHLFMLALGDRVRDSARLVGRTVWPESWWIDARYGRPVSRVEHVVGLIRRRAV